MEKITRSTFLKGMSLVIADLLLPTGCSDDNSSPFGPPKNYTLLDVHGCGAQRSDPKIGDPDDYPYGFGPQGDVIRIYNHARLVRSTSSAFPAIDYPIVDTGQDTCYNGAGTVITPGVGDAFYGQDAQYTGLTPNFTDNGNETITDNRTGLMWQKSADTNGDSTIDASDKLTYAEAVAYPATLNGANFGGHNDWRLPTIKELYSLIDFRGEDPSSLTGNDTSGITPFIDTNYFDFEYGDTDAGERIIDAQYASSTLYVGNTANDGGSTLFGVNFADGRIKGYGLTLMGSDKTFFVICVRDNTNYGINNFVDNGDGTITDSATGLMWMEDDSGAFGTGDNSDGNMTWEQSLDWAENLTFATHSDWRLPNAKELHSIVDYTRSLDTHGTAAIDPIFNVTEITDEGDNLNFPFYWTSTTHISTQASNPGAAAVYIAFGEALGWM